MAPKPSIVVMLLPATCETGVEQERTAASLAPIPGFAGVQVRRVDPTGLRERLRGARFVAALKAEASDAEQFHFHGVWDSVYRFASVFARRRRIPYCILLNGMLDPWSLSQRRFKKQVALALSFRRILNGASFLHLGNTDERELIRPLRLTTPTHIIPNGVFLEEIFPLPPPGTFRAAHPELGNRPFVLFLSRLHYKKGLDYLADAFAIVARENNRVELVVAGPDGGARPEFETAIRQHGIQARVHLTGPIYGTAKLGALVDAAVFCLPSRQEGFSVAITEALACGLPCVITPGCHFPEVQSEGAGLIPDLDAAAVAKALLSMLKDPAGLAEMSQRARDLVASRYTWPRIAQMCVEQYRSNARR